MKKFKITKEQILQLNSYNNYDCGVALKEWFPEAFQIEVEAGKWYIWERTKDVLLFITGFDGDKVKGYGIKNNDWFDNRSISDYWGYKTDSYFVPATDKEVETALIAEAKRRGFKGHFKVKPLWNSTYHFWSCSDNNIRFKNNTLFFSSAIFKDGKWAEILSEPIELTLEQRIEIIEEQLKIKK